MPDLSIQEERRLRLGLRRFRKCVAKIRLHLAQNALESHIDPSVLREWAQDISRFVPILDPAEYKKVPINGDWTVINVLTQVSIIVHTWEEITNAPPTDQVFAWLSLLEQSSEWSQKTHPVFRRVIRGAKIAARTVVRQVAPS